MSTPQPSRRRIAVVGMPNTGKSTVFNRLTGVQAKVGNWPGMTVDVLSARVILGGRTVELVDLPGLYSLHGMGEDERLVRHYLENEPLSALLVVLDATQLERQLPLALQLRELKRPLLVALNMADETQRLGIRVDTEQLAAALGAPVLLVSGKHGTGLPQLKAALQKLLETAPDAATNDAVLHADAALEAQAESIARAAVTIPHALPARISDKLDRVLLHPVAGVLIFLLLVFGLFQAVYGVGVPLQKGLNALIELGKLRLVEPLMADAAPVLQSFVLEGVIDGVGTVVSFVPIIFVFFIAMAVVEDSGYLVRVAFLMDRWMARLGLDGRLFVMQLMGLGCNVPAIMGTRIVRSRPRRLLSMLTIPFSLCSARLQVMVFLAAAFFTPRVAPLVMFGLYLTSFAVAFGTALAWRGRFASAEPFVLEFPPYRVPTLRTLAAEGWQSTRHFIESAGLVILAGVILIWLLTHLPFGAEPAGPETLVGRLASWMAPVFRPIGIDEMMSVALLMGFVAKEVVLGGMAVIYGAGPDELGRMLAERLTWLQAMSFMLFTLIYTPCLSTLAAIRRESRSLAFTAAAVAWPLAVAWVVSFVFYSVSTSFG
ncbi:MAG: ferrous iron transport protein B [Betaproteobacteria bacterium]